MPAPANWPRSRTLPEGALLARHVGAGNYTDCLCAEVAGDVPFARFVEAFYSAKTFAPERFVLAALLGKRSTVEDIRALAEGRSDDFAAWTVEDRAERQLLLCDFQQATRSWLMVEPLAGGGTRLLFGTAVVLSGQSGARKGMGRALFWSLLWFHKAYARLLLWGAVRHL
ncbi:MAG: hypothetical protein ACKOPQ_01520 [Novosphingobium sp.]